ncbi:MAG: hypothetical protein E6Q88_08550 [Lysobacteraceae bacterium]|nr:MAG: hypothetical protein E6Q88_08550 [Xanthomonadaceae bacterium]
MEEQTPQKIKQPPVLFKKTQALLTKIGERLGAPVLAYWNSPRGSICHSDVLAAYALLEQLGKHELIYLFVKSDGGNGQASLRLMNLIRQYASHVRLLAPLECSSAATMLALGADEIHMGPMAYLCAVDTSLTHDLSPLDRDNDRVRVSLDELSRVIRRWNTENKDAHLNPYQSLSQHVHPLLIGAVDRADSLSIMLCKELLSYHLDDESRILEIAQVLNSKYPSHGYPIMLDEARRIGLKVVPMDKAVNDDLLALNSLYSEMGQRATTDFDEIRSHSNEILNILEAGDLQIYFQNDKDWFYRSEERRWITLNDNSNWRSIRRVDGRLHREILHVA